MIWMLLKAEFLSLTLMLVYVGAVMVLFLFVVMMLDVNIESLRVGFWKHFPVAAVIGILIILEMCALLIGGFRVTEEPRAVNALGNVAGEISNTRELGKLLYTRYLYPLEVAAALLLVAMIAAVALTLRHRKDTKAIDSGDQVRVKASDRLMVINLKSTKPALPVTAPDEPTGGSKA